MITIGTNIKNLIESYNIEILEELILSNLSKREKLKLQNSLISIEGDNENIVFSKEEITYKKERVLLYIPIAYYSKNKEDNPYSLHKVHLSFCLTLKEQKLKGTLNQYGVTQRYDMHYHYQFTDTLVKNQKLIFCRNCVKQVFNDYNYIFDIKEFLTSNITKTLF